MVTNSWLPIVSSRAKINPDVRSIRSIAWFQTVQEREDIVR